MKMAQTIKQKALQLFIFAILLGVSMARPNGNAEVQQEGLDAQPNVADLEKMYAYYKPFQYFTYLNDPNLLDRAQLQFRSSYPVNSLFRGDVNLKPDDLSMWDTKRQLLSKRQARYRQCYFNPISCFRK